MKLMNLTPTTEIPGGKAEMDDGRQPHRRVHRRQRHLQFLHREDSRADIRRAVRRHQEILPRAQPARHDRDQRFPRRRHAARAFPRGADSCGRRASRRCASPSTSPADSLADYKALTAFTPMNFGDDWLRFRGIGESLTRGIYDGSTVGLALQPDRQGPRGVLRGGEMGRRARHRTCISMRPATRRRR